MIRALRTSATGMRAQQMNVDTIAHNLANVNTTGFKRTRMDFQDIFYQQIRTAGSPTADRQLPTGLQVGLGVRAAATQKLFSQGALEESGNPLDMAIEGEGFFQVTMPDGTIGYTRDGSFKRDAEGNVVTSDGYLLEPAIVVPQDATLITVAGDGTVSAQVGGEEEPQVLGEIQLATFSNPAGLTAVGKNLFRKSPASGEPIINAPGTAGFGTISQGFLEKANVDVVEEMVGMITAQRAYEVNSRVIQGVDEMLEVAGGLLR